MNAAHRAGSSRLVRTVGSRSLVMTLTLALVALVTGLATVAGSGTAAAQGGCTPYMAYLVPGTTETNPSADPTKPVGLLKEVGEELQSKYGNQITVIYVPYSASAFDKGLSYKGSQHTGVAALAKFMAKCPQAQVVLGGYSQGADVAGDVAWHIGHENKPVAASQVRGVALLSDPKGGKEAVVGGSRSGEGISGGRPGGYGQLEGRIKWICGDKDMYCNVKTSNPYAKVIGHIIGSGGTDSEVTPLDGGMAQNDTDAMASLASDFSKVDLTGAQSKVTDLKTRTQALADSGKAPTRDQLSQISDLAGSLNSTYTALNKSNQFANTSGAGQMLSSSATGTPENKTAGLLSTVNSTDMGALTSDTSSIADTANSLAGSLGSGDASSALTSGGESLKSLAMQAANVASQSSSLSQTDRSTLTAATGVLGSLQVSSVVDTSLMAMQVGLGTDYQGIFNDIAKMIDQLAKQDAVGAFDTSGGLMDKIEPWVNLASSANFSLMPMAASMVGAIPDPMGYTQIAAIIMKLLGQIDIKAIWNQAKETHRIAGQVIHGNPAAAVGLIPVGLNLAGIGVSALTGASTGLGGNTAPLGSGAGAGNGSGQSAAPAPAPSAGAATPGSNTATDGAALTSLVGKMGGPQDFTKLASDGLDYASFLNSGAHTSSYTNRTLVGSMSAVQYIAAYFEAQLSPSTGSSSGSGSSSQPSSAPSSDSGSSADEQESGSGSPSSEPTPGSSDGGNGNIFSNNNGTSGLTNG